MHIKQLTGRAIKGRSFDHDLAPGVLITGPNFSGKTTLLTSIRLAILGYLPELGKTHQATAKLATSTHFGVRLEFSDGRKLEREYRLKGDSVSASCSDEAFAKSILCPSLHAEEYFGLGPSARLDYILARTDGKTLEDFDPSAILAQIRNVELEENTVHTEKARAELMEVCQKAFKGRNTPEAIATLTADKTGALKVLGSTWNRTATDSVGAVRTLTELKLRSAECSAETIAGVEESLKACDARVAEAQKNLGALEGQADAFARTESRRKVLRDAIAQYSEAGLEALERLLAERKEAVKGLKDVELDGLRSRALAAQKAHGQAEGQLAAQRVAFNSIKAELDNLADLVACPTCGAHVEGWKDNNRVALEKKLSAASEALQTCVNNLQTAREAQDKVAKELSDAAAIEEANHQAHKALRDTEAEVERRHRARDQKAANERELAALTSGDAPTVEALGKAREEEEAALTERTVLRNRLRIATELSRDIAQAEEAAKKHEEAKANVHVIKAIGTKLKDIKARMTETAFKQVCDSANRIFPDLLGSPLAYHEDALGRWEVRTDRATFIEHDTFSGTEEALAYVSIAAALSSLAPFRILMLDEFSRLDPDNKLKALRALDTALRDEALDQVIVVDTIEPVVIPEGWLHIRLS